MHKQGWPTVGETAIDDGEARLLALVGEALSQVRKAKSEAKVSMRTEVPTAVVHGGPADVELLSTAADDLKSAGKIADLRLEPAEVTTLTVDVTL